MVPGVLIGSGRLRPGLAARSAAAACSWKGGVAGVPGVRLDEPRAVALRQAELDGAVRHERDNLIAKRPRAKRGFTPGN
jgi:hypothetical protein